MVMDESDLLAAEIGKAWLAESPNQLTFQGLTALYSYFAVNTLGVFFRNNHFSTVFRAEDALYLLVTDVGYEKVGEVVWERLGNIDGDTEYCNAEFGKPMLVDDYVGVGDVRMASEGMDTELQMALQASLRSDGGCTVGGGGAIGAPAGDSGTRVVLPPLGGATAGGVAIGVGVMADGGAAASISDEAVARQFQQQMEREKDEELVREMMKAEVTEGEREREERARKEQAARKKKESCNVS